MVGILMRDTALISATYDKGRLRIYLYSDGLPPLVEVGGKRAREVVKVLCNRLMCYKDEVGKTRIDIKPLEGPAILVWTIASLNTKNISAPLLDELMKETPTSAFRLILEAMDINTAYTKKKPFITWPKLRTVSKIIIEILKLHNYTQLYR